MGYRSGGNNNNCLYNMKYLPLYYEWSKDGKLPRCGLCNCLGEAIDEVTWVANDGFEDFEIMMPTKSDKDNHKCRGDFWGDDGSTTVDNFHIAFTPLRQNIILLLAAMNEEL